MNTKEPIKDCPELLTLVQAAKLLGVSRRWLQDRAEDYGAVLIKRKLRFFEDIVGSTVPQIIDLLKARLMKELQEYEQVQEQKWRAQEDTRAQLRREERHQRVRPCP